MTTYVTQQGDTWDLIAFRLTGSTEQVETIMKANTENSKTFIFPAGVELQIPTLNSVIDNSTLPPWKRT